MKSIISVLFILIFHPSFSQKKIHFGLHFAPTINFEKVRVDTFSTTNALNGYKIGLASEFDIDEFISVLITPSVDIRNNTLYYKPSPNSSIYQFYDNIYWLEVPVYLRFKFGDKIKFLTDIGIGSQHLISYDNSRIDGANAAFLSPISRSTYNSFLSFNYGIGLSYDYKDKTRYSFVLRNRVGSNGELYKSNQLSFNLSFMF